MHVPIVLGERVYGAPERQLHRARAPSASASCACSPSWPATPPRALQNALQFEQERHIAETLQQALIAEPTCPSVPGLELAALYQRGGRLTGGRRLLQRLAPPRRRGSRCWWATCSGKGVEAAGVTAMVRYMTEALSQHRREPRRPGVGAQRPAVPADGRRDPRDAGARRHRPGRRRAALVQRRPPAAAGDRRRGDAAGAGGSRPALRRPSRATPSATTRRPSRRATCWCSTPTASSRRGRRDASSARRASRGPARGHGRDAGPSSPGRSTPPPAPCRGAPHGRRRHRHRETNMNPRSGFTSASRSQLRSGLRAPLP